MCYKTIKHQFTVNYRFKIIKKLTDRWIVLEVKVDFQEYPIFF